MVANPVFKTFVREAAQLLDEGITEHKGTN